MFERRSDCVRTHKQFVMSIDPDYLKLDDSHLCIIREVVLISFKLQKSFLHNYPKILQISFKAGCDNTTLSDSQFSVRPELLSTPPLSASVSLTRPLEANIGWSWSETPVLET